MRHTIAEIPARITSYEYICQNISLLVSTKSDTREVTRVIMPPIKEF